MGTWPIYSFESLDSTSLEARRRAEAGECGPFWITAQSQSAGRGRLGRTWASPSGNLYASVLVVGEGGYDEAQRVPFAAGLAVVEACEGLVPGLNTRLKWPNDVRVDGAKLAGILVETGEFKGEIGQKTLWMCIGIGVNISHAPQISDRSTTCLADLCEGAAKIEPIQFLAALDRALQGRLQQAERDFTGLLQDWTARAEGLGEIIEAGPEHNRIKGVFEGLEPDGALRLRLPDGQRQVIRAGDIELIKHGD